MNLNCSSRIFPQSQRTKQSENGSALVTVLWLVLLLTLLGACILDAARTDRQEAGSDVLSAEHLAHVDGAIALTIQMLSDLEPQRVSQLRIPITYQWTVGDETLTVDVRDENERIDLNTADAPWLMALLISEGLSEAAAEREAAHLRYWNRQQPNSQTWRDHPPGDPLPVGSLQRVDEAARISPLWHQIVRCHDQILTTYTLLRTPALSANSPLPLLALLRWGHAQAGDTYAWPSLSSISSAPPSGQTLLGRVIRISVHPEETSRYSKAAIYEEVVRLTDEPSRPALVSYASPALASDPSCSLNSAQQQGRQAHSGEEAPMTDTVPMR